METQADIIEIKMTLTRIETLLSERSTGITKNAENIGAAFDEIKKLGYDTAKNKEDINRFTERLTFFEHKIEDLEKSNMTLSHKFQELHDAQLKLSLLSSFGTAVLTAAAVHFFSR
ncbi:MAG: hypothetical protein LBS60_09000 [Deltaproteobacteria bacterium]|jgi:chromosome segregation ATPase|nr:hypothetical protein [Deltaproteobacteria bacterium]